MLFRQPKRYLLNFVIINIEEMNRVIIIISLLVFSAYSFAAKCETDPGALQYFQYGCELGEREDFAAALDCFAKSLELADKEGNKKLHLDNLWRIGNIYLRYGDYARCRLYYEQGYTDAMKYDMPDMQFLFATNAVATFCLLDNIAEARRYFEIQDSIPIENSVLKHFYKLYNTGIIAQAQHDVTEAVYYHLQSLDFALSHNMDRTYSFTQYAELCDIYLADNQPEKAIHYAGILADSARSINDADLLSDAYGSMSEAYFMMRDTLSARKYKEIQILITDSIYNRHQFNKVKSHLLDYEKKNIDERISFLNHKITLQTAIIVCFAVLLAFSFFFLLYIYRSRKRLRVAHGLLIDKIRELNRIHRNTETPTEAGNNDVVSAVANGGELEVANVSMVGQGHGDNIAMLNKAKVENAPALRLSKEQINNICRDIDNVMNDVSVITDSNFSVSQLASMINTNSAYVSNVINSVYGKNFKALLNEHRINEACRRMADTDNYGNVTIQAIYEELGYRSASNFIKAFRAVTSMTPSEYLKLIKTK